MDAVKFTTKYNSFGELIFDVAKIIAHYEEHNLIVGYDVYPQSMTVEYLIHGKGQAI